jgi:aminoglycoside phosphotransferase family enzyme
VRMRKIPDKVLMKSLFQEGRLRSRDLKSIALVLAEFHKGAEGSVEIDTFGEAESFKVNTDENFQQTKDYVGKTIDKDDFVSLNTWTEEFYTRNRDLFRARIAKGKIRDCHGDLHMEHVCLTDPISVIDCIEFNDRFRYSDTISDIAFLLMDLEYHSGVDLAAEIWKHYAAETGERDVEALLTFYKVYRAYVRGKVNSFQLDDAQLEASAKKQAALRARRYFQLARSYIR